MRSLQNSLSLATVFQTHMLSNSTVSSLTPSSHHFLGFPTCPLPYSMYPGSCPFVFAIAVFVLCSFLLSEARHEVSKQYFFYGVRLSAARPTPTERTRASLFVWIITFGLSGMGGPTSSCATTSIALRIIWPHKPHHYVKVGMTLGGLTTLINKNFCQQTLQPTDVSPARPPTST
jgi:hypothetical protein